MSHNFLSRLTGSFAFPAAENPTVAMVEAAYAHHSLDIRSLNCEVPPEKLGDAVKGARAMGWIGFNCSIPHKVAVIEHLDGPIESLRAMRSRLPFDGQLVVTVPAFQFLWSHHDDVNQHRRRYSRLELVSQLSSAGLRVSFVSYYNTLLFPAVAGARLLERLMPSRFVKSQESDLEETPAPLNRLLTTLFGGERLAVGRASLPFGVSLIAVAQRNG